MEYEYTWYTETTWIPSIGPVLQSRKLEDATAVVDWICSRPTPLRENEVDAIGVAAAAAMEATAIARDPTWGGRHIHHHACGRMSPQWCGLEQGTVPWLRHGHGCTHQRGGAPHTGQDTPSLKTLLS